MENIKNIEKVTRIYPMWKPSDIAFIKALDWSIDKVVGVFYCQLRSNVVGWPDISKFFFEVSIVFRKVSGLKIAFGQPGLHRISGFDIVNVSDREMEGINFQIEDYENGSIEFFCKEIEIFSASDPFMLKL